MKLYVVADIDYLDRFVGVYSTKEKAEQALVDYVEEYQNDLEDCLEMFVFETELDHSMFDSRIMDIEVESQVHIVEPLG